MEICGNRFSKKTIFFLYNSQKLETHQILVLAMKIRDIIIFFFFMKEKKKTIYTHDLYDYLVIKITNNNIINNTSNLIGEVPHWGYSK